MHYYQFNIGDYRKDTAHLTPMEHYIYRTLIDWYYLDEAPISIETQVVIRRLSLDFSFEQSLTNVLQDFFVLGDKGWEHKRINVELHGYHEQCVKNQTNGKLGGRPRKTQVVSKDNPKEPKCNPNQEPLTNNKEPVTKNNGKSKTPAALLASLGIDEKIADDWMAIRKTKKAAITQTALNGIIREAEKAGMTLQDVLKKCCEENWSGFKASWLNRDIGSTQSANDQAREGARKKLFGGENEAS